MREIIIERPNLAVLNQRDANTIDSEIDILTRMINRRRQTNVDVYGDIAKDEANLIDGITHYNNMSFKNVGKELEMNIKVDNGVHEFKVHRNAVMQLANKFKINGRHISNLLKQGDEWAMDTLAYTLSRYMGNTRMNDMGLFRAVTDEHNC